MFLTKVWKSFLIITFSVIIGFSFFTCGSSTPEDDWTDDWTPEEDSYVPGEFEDYTAVEIVKQIKLGWNLGNTFDAGGGSANMTVNQLETLWVKHITNKSNIEALKKVGFNAIRIPVTWSKAMDSNSDIRKDWLSRVTEVVDYAYGIGMFVVINTHHDESIFKFYSKDYEASLEVFKKVWQQIAIQFKDYDERLIFEGLNEPRTKDSAAEWNGGTKEERDNLNKYYQAFVDTVRVTGGHNDKRFLMINTYAASAWNPAVNDLVLPEDNVKNKLIVSIHAYTPYDFALSTDSTKNKWSISNSSDTSSINSALDPAYNKFVSKGIPVILGEFGAMNKNNENARAEWAKYFVGQAKSKEIPCFWWDNGVTSGSGELFGLIDRTTNTIIYPKIMVGLRKGAGLQ